VPGPRPAYRRRVREVVAPPRVRRVADVGTAALRLRRMVREARRRRSTELDASTSSIGSIASVLSIGSAGSVLSIGSAGSVLSIGSAGSVLSIGSVGSVLSIGAAGGCGMCGAREQGRRARAAADGARAVGPRATGTLLAVLALAHAVARR
jgi:hypothetical protein